MSILESQFGDSWLVPEIHRPLCELISNFKENTRCAVILPRGWLKSQVCSVYYPIWRAMKNPNFTSLIVQNTFTNATKKLQAIRTTLRTNPLLRLLYPERMPNSSCQMSSEAICLPRTAPIADATFEAAGVGTEATSRHFDLLIEDDTIAPEYDHMTGDVYEPSDMLVEKAIGFHSAAHYLLHDFKYSQRIVVGTRWRERDLFSYIKAKKLTYKFIERGVRETDGKPDPHGDLVYPTRFDDDVLEEMKQTVGDYMFNALMLSSPLSGKDAIFDVSTIPEYEEYPKKDLYVFTTVDPAPQESKSSDPDYNVVLTTGISADTGRIYVLDYFRERCTPGDLIDAIFGHVERFSPITVGIECVAYQKTLKWWIEETQNK